jgi:nucleoside phosphorylase
MKLLMVASDAMELRGILARAGQPQRVEWGVDRGWIAQLNGSEVALVANGVGWKRAAQAVEAACRNFRPDGVVSTGLCGALDPKLPVAAVVSATSIAGPGRSYPALPVSNSSAFAAGLICSVDYVVRTAEEKTQLRASGAIAVEMEAAGVAAGAEARGLPFYCVRAVSDLAGETMANDFNAALRADGHFDTMIILRDTLRHASVRVPELLRLRNRSVRAARVLGEFIADCRF